MRLILFGLLFPLCLGCGDSNAPTTTSGSTADRSRPATTGPVATGEHPSVVSEPVDRTNTGVNVRDRDSAATTPFDQKENKADIAVTADIRKQVVDSKLSVTAQNVKIVTQDGKVTLRGPVKTAAEKSRIEEIARAVAGDKNVNNQLEVNNE